MITKNEASCLHRCLSSVKDLVDEIIILDTGSTDETKAIAVQFTDKIFDVVWQDDFSAARNDALQHATGDWILVLDADETLAVEDHARIRETIQQEGIVAYCMLTRNYTADSTVAGWVPDHPSGWFPSLKIRLFRNHLGIHFVGSIHEMVESTIQGKIADVDVPVHHYGIMTPSKQQYYVTLLQKKAEEQGDAKSFFELGVQHKELGQLKEAEVALRRSLNLDPLAIEPQLNLAVVLRLQGKLQDARSVYDALLGRLQHAEAYAGRAYCSFVEGKRGDAIADYRSALELDPDFVEAYVNLGGLLEKEGKYKEAALLLQKAMHRAPLHARAHYNLAVVYQRTGNTEKAKEEYAIARGLGWKE